MFSDRLTNFDSVPLSDGDRKKTDIICSIIGSLFAVTMLTLAIIFLNTDNFQKSNFPTDSDHIPCSYGANQQYQFVYFPDIQNPSLRVCISRCPNAGDSELVCRTNSQVPSCAIPNIYPATINFDRLGGFCAPNDLKSQNLLINSAGLNQKWKFLDIYDTIRISLLIAVGLGLAWFVLVHVVPRVMAALSTFLSVIVLIGGGTLVLVDEVSGWENLQFWKYFIAISLILVGMLFGLFICFYRKRMIMTALFLDWSTKFIADKIVILLYILLFIAFTLGLIILCFFQHLAFLSHTDPQPSSDDIYLKFKPNVLLVVLNIIEFIWGLQFLKDSFNFIISGLATQWYTNMEPNCCISACRQIKYHFGSVVGGSFLNAFLNVLDFVLESIRCYPDGACSTFAPCCNMCFNNCGSILDLVRTDVYSYINLTGIAYCNAARNCQALIHSSKLFVGSQSVLYFYRISSYIFTVGLVVIISYFIEKSKFNAINLFSLILIVLFAYCILTYFVDIHPNAAEGIQITYLLQSSFSNAKQLINDRFSFKKQAKTMEQAYQDAYFC